MRDEETPEEEPDYLEGMQRRKRNEPHEQAGWWRGLEEQADRRPDEGNFDGGGE